MTTAVSSGQQPDDLQWFERFFVLNQAGARRRRRFLLLLSGLLWGFFAYLLYLPGDEVFATLQLLLYPFRILLDIRIFVVLLVMLVSFQGILLVVLVLFGKPLWKLRYWLPACLALALVMFRLLWGPYLTQPQWSPQMGLEFLLYPLKALINPSILQHVLIIALGFWVAYQTAAVYLDDIYELGDVQVARRFVSQAVFGSQFNLIEIKGGDVPRQYKKSPLIRIGGPGWAQVHLDNVALFEAIDGTPRVIGPTVAKPNNREVLAGFERLRAIIDLTDRIEKFDVNGRTRDGIRIALKDVTVVFSVYRGRRSSTLSRPYPFDPLAIHRLVYGQGTTNWAIPVSSLIRRRFGEFISRHTLSEFLAAVGQPEVLQEQQEQVDLQGQFTRLGGMPLAGTNGQTIPPNFRTRPDMMTELFAEEFEKEAARKGVEIKWIGGGTWEMHDAVVPQRHLEAWKLSRENLVRGSPESLDSTKQESLFSELARLVQEVPVHTYSEAKDQPAVIALRRLILAYHKIIREAYQQYQNDSDDPAQLEWLRQVLVFLTRFTARWLGGP